MSSDSPESGPENRPKREGWPRWSIWVLIGLVVASFVVPPLLNSDNRDELLYSEFIE